MAKLLALRMSHIDSVELSAEQQTHEKRWNHNFDPLQRREARARLLPPPLSDETPKRSEKLVTFYWRGSPCSEAKPLILRMSHIDSVELSSKQSTPEKDGIIILILYKAERHEQDCCRQHGCWCKQLGW